MNRAGAIDAMSPVDASDVPMNRPLLAVVEDNPHVAKVVCKLAARAGFSTRHYPTAISLRTAPTSPPPLCILLDLGLPDDDGIALLDYIQEQLAASAIIIMSGKDPSVIHAAGQLVQARGLNLIGTLHKPFRLRTLHSLLERVRGERRRVPRDSEEKTRTVTSKMLRQALQRGEFIPFYQPQVMTRDGSITGFEALMRWQHPQWGIVAPGRFIGLAAQNHLLTDITWMMLEKVATHWRELAWRETTVSANLPASFLDQPHLPEKMIRLTARHGIAPAQFTLEVTESEALQDVTHQLGNLVRLRLAGFPLSIDDFGTGYSSLISLYQTPFQELKIDQAFVMRADSDPVALEIIRALVFLSQRLRVQLIAEGVETEQVRQLMARLGVARIQGYLIHPPMPFEELSSWKDTYKPEKIDLHDDTTETLEIRSRPPADPTENGIDETTATHLEQALKEHADEKRFRDLFANAFAQKASIAALLTFLLHREWLQLQQEMESIRTLPDDEQHEAIRKCLSFFERARQIAIEVRESRWQERLREAEERATHEHLNRILAESSMRWLRHHKIKLTAWLEEVPVQATVRLIDLAQRHLIVELNRELARLLAINDYRAFITTHDGNQQVQVEMTDAHKGRVRLAMGAIVPNRMGKRRHVRVRHPQQPEGKVILQDSSEIPCRIVDLSISGLRLSLPLKARTHLAPHQTLRCRFPVSDHEILGKGTIRWMANDEQGQQLLCGISFFCANSAMQKLLHEETLRLQRDLIARLNSAKLPVLLRNALDEMAS